MFLPKQQELDCPYYNFFIKEIVMNSANQCNSGQCCCSGSKWTLFFLSIIFSVSAAIVLGGLLAVPVTLYVGFLMPDVFGTYAQAFECLTPTFALFFFALTVICRLVHVSLKGVAYFKETYFYEYLVE